MSVCSWGKYWGEKGYFRIKHGVDEARFESWPYCYGGVAADVVPPMQGCQADRLRERWHCQQGWQDMHLPLRLKRQNL